MDGNASACNAACTAQRTDDAVDADATAAEHTAVSS
jgi:hypothetical protein